MYSDWCLAWHDAAATIFFSCNVRGVGIVDTTSMVFIITFSSLKKRCRIIGNGVLWCNWQIENKSPYSQLSYSICGNWLAAMIHLDRLCPKTSAAHYSGTQFHRNFVRHWSSTIWNEDCHTTSHTIDGGQNRRVVTLCDHVMSLRSIYRARIYRRITNWPLWPARTKCYQIVLRHIINVYHN